jgi:hypothetical protein
MGSSLLSISPARLLRYEREIDAVLPGKSLDGCEVGGSLMVAAA